MHTTEWTAGGYRIKARLVRGAVALTCESRALTWSGSRALLIVSRLVVPACTSIQEAERITAHWLAFYGDDALAEVGRAAYRAVFDSAPEIVEPSEPESDTSAEKHDVLN